MEETDQDAVLGIVTQRYEPAVPVGHIEPHPLNPHEAELEPIRGSIQDNGFYGAVIVQESTGHIVVGEHRWRSAIEEGADTIPVIYADVDDATAMRIMLADNRTSDLASYDITKQAAALQKLVEQRDEEALKAAGYSADEYASIVRGADSLIAEADEQGQASAKAAKPPGLKDAFTLVTVGRFKAHVEKNTFADWYADLIVELGTEDHDALAAEIARRLQITIEPTG